MKISAAYYISLWLISTFDWFRVVNGVCSLTNGQNAVYWSIYEDQKVDTLIGILPVSGYAVHHIGESRTISLRLITGHEFLTLNTAAKQLILIQALDRETKGSKIEAVVECSSILPDDDFQVNITVYVNIKDVNDNPPKFPSDVLRIKVNEEFPISTIIYSSLKAFDEDSSGPNSEISYYMLMNSSDQEDHSFSIPNPWIGEIVTKSRIDYETSKQLNTTIMAMDNGQPRLNSTILFIVDVVDIDDQNPKFEYDQYSVTMNCSQTNNTLTVLPKPIQASDQDTLNASIFYTLSGVHSDKFRIDRDDGKLFSDHVFKNNDFFLLTIHAAQTDKPERQATAVLAVKSNLSTSLRFSDSKYSVNVQETARIGQEILKIKVIDTNSSEKVRFFLDDGSGKFVVEEKTGVVRLKQNLDYEQQKNYILSCRVSNELEAAVAPIEIHVRDVNESPPKFESDEYLFKPRSTEDGSFVGQIRATDLDIDDKIQYQLMDSTKIFRLNGTGAIFIGNGSSIRNTSYVMVIIAADNGHPSKNSRCTVFVDFSNLFPQKFKQIWTTSNSFSAFTISSTVLWGTLACIFLLIFVVSSVVIIILARRRRYDSKSGVNSIDLNNGVAYGITPSLAYGCPLGGSLAADHLRSVISNEDAFLNFGRKPPLFNDICDSIHRRNLASSLMFDRPPPVDYFTSRTTTYGMDSPPTVDMSQQGRCRFLPSKEVDMVQNSRSDGDHFAENHDVIGRINSNEFCSFTVL